jgi:hypothetical protein
MKHVILASLFTLQAGVFAMALMPQDAPKVEPKQAPQIKKPLEGRPPYSFVRERAIKENKVLIVFVKCHPELALGTALRHYVDTFPDCNEPCIVVGVPHNKELYRSDHKTTATELDIMEATFKIKAALHAKDERKKP